MLLFQALDLTLPLKNPVLLFSLILFIILFAPILLNKVKIPHLIGLIIAGAIIGPNGLNLMLRDSSITLYGYVGLLYIMFLAGLEIDLAEFKKNKWRSLYFGALTFSIPMILGTLGGKYILGFPNTTSILLASMFASHTLIAYPIISKLGVNKNKAVNITVGGTMITDTAALLVLAAIVGMSKGADIGSEFWIKLSLSVIAFGLVVMFGFPIIGRWFFKKFDDNISQYIFVLAMVFMGGFMAEVAGIEAIIGAFLAGLALNKLIPYTSPLMNRIEFVGNALFIPIFLIGVGMLIDFKMFFKNWNTIFVAFVMIIIATVGKFLAAWITQKTFKFNVDERRLIFGLSNAQAAATLAAVLVGYNVITSYNEIKIYKNIPVKNNVIYTEDNKEIRFLTLSNKGNPGINSAALVNNLKANGTYVLPDKTKMLFDDGKLVSIKSANRLLNENVLNGTILMILVTCTVASFVAQRGAQNLALAESGDDEDSDQDVDERILIPLNDIDTTEELVNLSMIIKSKKNKRGLYALNIVNDENPDENSDKKGKKILDKAIITAAASDTYAHEMLRYDVNVVNGISSVVKEKRITDMVLGLNKAKGISSNFLHNLNEGILNKCNTTTLIYKTAQPLNTIKRHIIVVPDRAEKEIGFPFWLVKVWNIAKNTGAKLIFHAPSNTLNYIREIHEKHPIESEFYEFTDWNDFLIISRDVKKDDNLIIVMSRPGKPSYNYQMSKMPHYLNSYFIENNYILIYPIQIGVTDKFNVDLKNPTFLEPLERLDDIGKTLANLFKRKG